MQLSKKKLGLFRPVEVGAFAWLLEHVFCNFLDAHNGAFGDVAVGIDLRLNFLVLTWAVCAHSPSRV